MEKKFFLCYDSVLTVRTESYNESVCRIFSELTEKDFNIKINADELFLFFQEKLHDDFSSDAVAALESFFNNSGFEIDKKNFTGICYKLRVSARLELRIDRRAPEILKNMRRLFHLILVCNCRREFALPELNMFKLPQLFDEIIFTDDKKTDILKTITPQYPEFTIDKLIISLDTVSNYCSPPQKDDCF